MMRGMAPTKAKIAKQATTCGGQKSPSKTAKKKSVREM